MADGDAPVESDTSGAAAARLGSGLALVGLLLGTVVLAFRRLDDWDLPWNLATGRIIVQTKSVPRVDDLAFTHGVVKYTEVAADVVLYGVMRALGPLGLQVFGGLIAAATAWLVHRQVRRFGPLSFVVVAIAMVAAHPWLYVRPQTISFLLLAAVMLAIELHREEPERHRRALWAIVPLQLVWANVHGYAPLGVMLLLAYGGERALRERRAGLPLLVAAVAAAATSISTAGPRLLVMMQRFDEDLAELTEWTAPTPSIVWHTSPAFFLVLALLVVALLFGREPDSGTGGPGSTRRAPPLYEVFILVLSAAMLARAIRFVPVVALLTVPLITRRLAPFVRPTRAMQIACGFAAVLPAFVLFVALEDLLGVGWQPGWFPENAARWIEERRPAGRMWNFMPFGGYLAWRLHPKHRIFNDGRNALARDRSIVTRARLSMSDAAVFQELVREHDMQWAVTCTIGSFCPPSAQLNAPLTTLREWRMVYLDEVAAIYVREGGPNRALAEQGYLAIHHLTTARELLEVVQKKSLPAPLVAHDGRLAVTHAPNSVRAQTYAAIGALAIRDKAAFDAALGRIQALAPESDAVPTLQAAWQAP
ncbi:MAG: hypothetical protein HYV09_39985 [Deltaproteobacteria bacterium]|nr:hypothetical protein [Deltaproteobacteria bacterium]